MKRLLRMTALVVIIGAIIVWVALGANRGWTRTSVPVKTVDPVTGIEGIEYRKQFVPGLEFLGGSMFAAGLLAGVSFLFRVPQSKQQIKSSP